MAYYNVLFDRAVDEAYELIGCGLQYLEQTRHSTFTAEVHVRYLRELHAGDPVRVTFQLLDFDAKRMHYFEQLFHAEEGWLSATSENMTLHVDMTAKKSAPFPAFIMERLARMKAAHASLPAPAAPADASPCGEFRACRHRACVTRCGLFRAACASQKPCGDAIFRL